MPSHRMYLGKSTDRISTRVNASSASSPSVRQEPDLGEHFIFESASGKEYKILFCEVSSLEASFGHFKIDQAVLIWIQHLHGWLLGVFHERHAGRKFIEDMSYVLRNTNTNRGILPSSPSPRPFRDIISANDRVEMSIVIPYDKLPKRQHRCPSCNTRRKKGYQSCVEVTCSKCDLRIEFHSSSSTHPDPLTRIALDDIRASGMKPFFESQSAPTYISGASTTVEMESWLESKIAHTRSYFEKISRPSEKHEAPDPWVFRRVVVCNSQWPGDANWSNIEEAEQSISNTVDTLNQCLTIIDTHFEDHPSNPMTGDLDLARWAARQYSNRQPSPNSTFALRQRFEVGGTFHKQFNSSVICLRCFLWLYVDILSVEANILRACSGTLHMDPPRVLKVEEPSMFQKVVRFLSTTTMLLVPLPITLLNRSLGLPPDPEPQLMAPEPPLIAPAICELMGRSRDLCFHYRMNGNLSSWPLCLFPLTGRAEKATWLEAYRQCQESIIETEGKRLMRSYKCERIRLYET